MQEHDPTAVEPDDKPLEGGDVAEPSPPQEDQTPTPDSPPQPGAPEDVPPDSPPPGPRPEAAQADDDRGTD